MMKNFLKKYNITLTVVLYTLALGALFYWVIRPLFSEIYAKNDKIQEAVATQENKEKRLKDLAKLRSQFEMVKGKEDNLILLLDKNQAVDLIENFEKIADLTGNKIMIEIQENKEGQAQAKRKSREADEKQSIGANLPSDNYLILNISLTGSYANLFNFVKKVENMEYYADVLAINVSVNQNNEINKSQDDGTLLTNNVDNTQASPEISQDQELNSIIKVAVYVKE